MNKEANVPPLKVVKFDFFFLGSGIDWNKQNAELYFFSFAELEQKKNSAQSRASHTICVTVVDRPRSISN